MLSFSLRVLLGAVFLATAIVGCDGEPDAIATVSGYTIDAAQLRAAAAKLTEADDLASLTQAQREQIMQALVGARLLALEAERRGLDDSETVRRGITKALRDAVNEALREREIEAAIEITPGAIEVQYAAWGSGEEIEAAHILLTTPDEAEAVLGQLAAGEDFARLAVERSQHAGSAYRGGSMGFLRKFMIPDPLRPALWGQAVGSVHPEPIRSRMGYHVVKVLQRRRLSLIEQEGAIRTFLTSKQRAILERELHLRLQQEGDYEWRAQTAATLIRMGPSASGDSVLARWRGGELTLADYRHRASGPDAVSTDTARVRRVVEQLGNEDLVLAAGKAQGLDALPEVQRRVEDARLKLLGEALFASLSEEVGDSAAVRSFYEQYADVYREPQRVNVQEVLVAEASTADSIHALVAAGADMADLARRHSLRAETRDAGGLWSGVERSEPGSATIYRQAMMGEGLLAPVGVPTGGFSVIRVLEKLPGEPLEFDAAEETVRSDLQMLAMETLIARLHREHAAEISIDGDRLAGLR